MGCIYKITSPSGKVYIGQTVKTLHERIKGHKKVVRIVHYLKEL
jgi:predicted GIY-YIG superfamily endonuclease